MRRPSRSPRLTSHDERAGHEITVPVDTPGVCRRGQAGLQSAYNRQRHGRNDRAERGPPPRSLRPASRGFPPGGGPGSVARSSISLRPHPCADCAPTRDRRRTSAERANPTIELRVDRRRGPLRPASRGPVTVREAGHHRADLNADARRSHTRCQDCAAPNANVGGFFGTQPLAAQLPPVSLAGRPPRHGAVSRYVGGTIHRKT